MTKPEYFKVVTNRSLDDLVVEVNSLILEGWEPVGAVTREVDTLMSYGHEYTYYQSMCRAPKEKG